MKLEFPQQIFKKHSNIKFSKNTSISNLKKHSNIKFSKNTPISN